MDRQERNKYITRTQSEVERLSRELRMLSYTDPALYPESYEKISTDIALLGERITCRLRHLVYDMTDMKKAEYFVAAGEAHGIEINYGDGIFEIVLPRLLPKKRAWSSSEFLIDPLYFTLNNFMNENRIPIFEHCVVCFTHVYDERLHKSRVRDYDNLEVKQVLDAVATFVLTDDTGRLCDMYHTTEFGATSYTRITIMEKQRFPTWLEARK